MDENKLMLLFLSEELGTDDPKKILNYLKGLDESKQKALATKYQLWKEAKKKKLAAKAAHGAKLSYVKTLKHICPEGLELVYFKKGGSVKCGCVGKKLEEGAKVENKPDGIVSKFKKKGESVARKITDTIAIITGTKSGVDKAREVKEKELHNTVGDGTSKSHRFDVNKPKFKNDYSSKRVKDSEKDYLEGRGDHLYKNGSKLKSAGCGCAVKKFKAKCGSKMKKHKLGGSLNGIPFYLEGTNKGGITEKSDNTRVRKIPNNGEAMYERTPQGIGDFVPFLGTYRAAQRIDKGEPNASYGDLIMNGAMDALGTRMVFPVLKAASKFRNIEKGLKSRGFVKGSERAHMKNGSGTDFHKRTVEVVNDYTGKPHYFEHWGEIKTVPNVDYYNVAMQPMIQTLRVPATAPFK